MWELGVPCHVVQMGLVPRRRRPHARCRVATAAQFQDNDPYPDVLLAPHRRPLTPAHAGPLHLIVLHLLTFLGGAAGLMLPWSWLAEAECAQKSSLVSRADLMQITGKVRTVTEKGGGVLSALKWGRGPLSGPGRGRVGPGQPSL